MPCGLDSSAWQGFGSLVAANLACSPDQSPDELRKKTAEETPAIKRDTKAVAEGVKQGLARNSR